MRQARLLLISLLALVMMAFSAAAQTESEQGAGAAGTHRGAEAPAPGAGAAGGGMMEGMTGMEATQPAKQVQSSLKFDETLSKLRSATDQQGMKVVADVDQGSMASQGGAKINARSLLLASPEAAQKLLQADPSTASAIPVRINIFERSGQTFVSYVPPSQLLNRFSEAAVRESGPNLDQKIQTIVGSATK